MKTQLKWAAAVLVVCMAVLLVPPLSRAEGTGRTITVGPKENLVEVIKTAQNGDTIVLNAGCNATLGNDTPWVIDKSVTFEGGDITLWVGGIILGADVTFRNTALSFGGFVRNAIMANGHTLTLENVTCAENGRPLNLFCGGLYDATLGSTQCSAGTVIIKGKTSLEGSINTVTNEVGNIYAGNLCMGGMNENVSNVDGPDNVCQGNAKIIIDADSTSTLGGIYAGGAQQKIPLGAANGKVILTDPKKYTVDGRVDITLNGATVKQVYGRGAEATYVTYTDTGSGYPAEIWVDGLSGLAVKTGYLVPIPAENNINISGVQLNQLYGDGLLAQAAVSVASGARLNLANLGNLTVGSFVGGGALCLGQWQTLTIEGDVAGTTSVVIGGFDAFLKPPYSGHIYIVAPSSSSDSFALASPSGQTDPTFVKNEDGEWFSGEKMEEDPVIVKTASFVQSVTAVQTDESFVEIELKADYVENNTPLNYLDYLPLDIQVNGTPATPYTDENGYRAYYIVELKLLNLRLEMASDSLSIMNANLNDSIPDGTYVIEVTIPREHTESGQPLTASTTLKVGGDGVIGGISPGEGAPNTVRIHLAAPGGPVTAGTVMAAVYDEKGRLLSFGSVEIPAEGSTSVDVPVHLSGGREVRAFLTDDSKPLCPSQSAELYN